MPSQSIQAQVELLIQLNIARCIAGGMHLIEDSNKWRNVLSLETLGSFLGGQHLQGHTNFVVLDKVLNGGQENRDPSMWVDLHQAIALKQSKCLANWSRTDPKVFRYLNLTQPAACRALSCDDFVAQSSRNLLCYRELCKSGVCAALSSLSYEVHTLSFLTLTNILYIMHNIQHYRVLCLDDD